MPNIKSIKQALEVFSKYSDKFEEEWLCAEHDQLYFPKITNEISPEDIKTLNDLGFFIDEDTKSWSCFA